MRIAWVHNFGARANGAGAFMWQMYDALQAQGIELKEVPLEQLASVRGVWRAMKTLREQCTDCDLIHVQYGSLVGFLASLTLGKRVVMTLRGSDLHVTPLRVSFSTWAHGVIAKTLTLLALIRTHHVIVCSQRMGREIAFWRCGRDISVIPDPIILDKFQPVDRRAARAQLGFSEDTRPWVLFSSFMTSNALKRKELAQAALELAQQTYPDLQLRFMNAIPHHEVPVHVSAANVVLLTSTHEGWPNIIKEGLACNVPFVSTDVSDLIELAEKTSTCHVCDATPQALAAGLVRSLSAGQSDDLRALMAPFDMSVVVDQIISLYHSQSHS